MQSLKNSLQTDNADTNDVSFSENSAEDGASPLTFKAGVGAASTAQLQRLMNQNEMQWL